MIYGKCIFSYPFCNMKSSILFVAFGCILSFGLTSTLSAASGDAVESTTTESVVQVENPLLIDSIDTTDDMHINVVFNQDVIRESVRVRISKQSDESNVRIDSFTGGEDGRSIQVILSDSLEANTSYKMTIISAISEDGVIIKDGADGIKEFSTPEDLKKYVEETIELSAPANPNAVIVEASGSQTGEQTGGTVLPKPTEPTGENPLPSTTAEELPLTGVNSTIFLAVAGVLALIFVLRRRQA